LINIPHFSDPALGGWLKGAIFYFKVAVSLAVAAIPEGLPAVITTCLALGTQRMAKRGAIVTALPAVETLGCTNVICSDKTGTLTTNQMSVLQFFVVGDNKKSKEIVEFKVDGTTYSPFDDHGLLCNVHCLGDYSSVNLKKNQRVDVPATLPSVERLARICALNNDSSVVKKEDGTYDKLGQPTEASMKVLVEKLLLSDPKQIAQLKNQTNLACPVNNHWEKSHQKLAVLEFNRQRKSMSVLVKDNNGAKTLLVKGAWDAVLSRCTNVNVNGQVVALDERLRKDLEKKVIDYCEGENNFRCLVLAERENIKDEAAFTKAKAEDFEKLESGLTFVGVVAILDPPRPEVRESIEKCKTAGIRVIVITGDNKATAVSICKKIGVFDADEDTNDKAFTGAEWKKLTEDQKNAAVKSAKLFARVEPIDKQDLVKYLHKHNMVVAMTGDGVNDAPALAEADIGIAMGTGTAVAKGAAKMVLANDNFATIVAAVEEGRNIYNNTKQFIRYLICSNIGEVVSIFTTAVLGLPEVLLPVQLLWVNLVTDGLPAVALGFNKPEEGIMIQKPRPRDEPIVTRWTLIRYLVVGTYIGLATVAGMVWWYMFYEQGPKLAWEDLFLWSKCQANTVSHGRSIDCSIFHDNNPNTVALSVLVTIEMFQALNSLSENSSLLSRRSHPFSNPHLLGAMALSFGLHFLILYVPMFAKLFSVAPINWVEWQAVIMLSAPVILVDEFLKVISRTFLVDNVKPKSD
jgi:Ca2+ transporting ATPase